MRSEKEVVDPMNRISRIVRCSLCLSVVACAAMLASAEQAAHWSYDGETGTISDGVWTFTATILSEEQHEIRVWTVDAVRTGTLAAAVPLDFSKPVRVSDGGDGFAEYDAVELRPAQTSTIEDKVLTSSYVGKVSAFKFNAKTRYYPPAFLYNATALAGRLTFPSTLTTLTGNSAFRGMTALQEIEFKGPVELNGFRLLQDCTAVTNIIGSEYITMISGNPCLSTGSKKLSGMPVLDLSSATVIDGATLQSTGCKVLLGDGLTRLGTNSLTDDMILNFPPPGLIELGSATSRTFELADGKLVLPESLTTIAGVSTMQKSGYNVISGASFMSVSGVEEVVFPAGVTSVPIGLFDRCASVRSVTFTAGKIDSIGPAICNSPSITDLWFTGAAPDDGNLDDQMLAWTATAGGKVLDNLKDGQLTIHVPRDKGWEKYADGGVIPGTITKGTTQKIKYLPGGLILLLK